MTKLRRLHTILRRGRRAEQRRVAARSQRGNDAAPSRPQRGSVAAAGSTSDD